jgi:hypothetical protein
MFSRMSDRHNAQNIADPHRLVTRRIPARVRVQFDRSRFIPASATFAAAVKQAHARSIMRAYNSVDGTPATQNQWLLTEVLRRRWGFEEFAISDAAATGGATVLHMTEPDTPAAAAHAWRSGLDVVFQSSFPQYRPYFDAARRGLVAPVVIDAAVSRVLRVKFDLGLFEHPYVDPDAAADANGSADHLSLAREAARASLVLLKNDGDLLPLAYNHKPTGRGDDYVDLTGQPLFPFGHGLSYTRFAYSALRIEPAAVAPAGKVTVRCTVSNSGARAGDEVVQLYVRDVLASVARPVMELKGFQRVRLEPGQAKELVFGLGPEHLQMLDATLRWVVEPGTFRVMIGGSSKDIRLRGEFAVR